MHEEAAATIIILKVYYDETYAHNISSISIYLYLCIYKMHVFLFVFLSLLFVLMSHMIFQTITGL